MQFEITCHRYTTAGDLETYVETVTTHATAVTNGPDRYHAESPLWGRSPDTYPDARSAALQLAYSKAAAVKNCAQIVQVVRKPTVTTGNPAREFARLCDAKVRELFAIRDALRNAVQEAADVGASDHVDGFTDGQLTKAIGSLQEAARQAHQQANG